MKISFIVPTYRWGGWDVLLGGLQHQTLSRNEWELIVADDLYDQRREEVKEYAERLDINLVHFKPPKSDKPFACNHAINWGLRWAEGDYVMIGQDFLWLEPDCFERHMKIQKPEGRVTCGYMHHYVAPPLKDLKGKLTVFDRLHEEKPSTMELPDRRFQNLTLVPTDLGYEYRSIRFHFYLTSYSILPNCVIPLHTLIMVNGLDERLDIGHGFQDDNLIFRLNFLNHEFILDEKNSMVHVTHPWSRKEQAPQQTTLHYNILMPILQGFAGHKAQNTYDMIQERCRVRHERWLKESGGIEKPPSLNTYEHPAQQKRVAWIKDMCTEMESILEIGCSSGYVLLKAGENASKLAGIDRNRNVIEHNRTGNPEVTWIHGDITHGLPFPNDSYDCVIQTEILEHIPFQAVTPAIMEAVRVAKKRVLITLPNAAYPRYNRRWVESEHHQWALTIDRLHNLSLVFHTGLWMPTPNFTFNVKYMLDEDFCYFAVDKWKPNERDEVFERAVKLKEMKEKEMERLTQIGGQLPLES